MDGEKPNNSKVEFVLDYNMEGGFFGWGMDGDAPNSYFHEFQNIFIKWALMGKTPGNDPVSDLARAMAKMLS